jgi:hypothetical protein
LYSPFGIRLSEPLNLELGIARTRASLWSNNCC